MKTKKVFLGLLALASVGMLFITGCGKKNDTKTTKDSKTTKQVTTKKGETTKKNSTTKGGGIKAFVITFAAEGQQSYFDSAIGDYTLPPSSFEEPEGKVFKCWDVDGVEKHPGDKIDVTNNIVITAIFRDKEQTDEEKEIYNKLVNVMNNITNYEGEYSVVYDSSYQEPGDTTTHSYTEYYGGDIANNKGYKIFEGGDSDGIKYKYVPKVRDGVTIENAFIKCIYDPSSMDFTYGATDIVCFKDDAHPGRELKEDFDSFSTFLTVYNENKELLNRYINYMVSNGEMAEYGASMGMIPGPSNFTFDYTTTTDNKYKVTLNLTLTVVSAEGDYPYMSQSMKAVYIFDDTKIYSSQMDQIMEMAMDKDTITSGFEHQSYEITYDFDETKFNSINTDQTKIDSTISIFSTSHPLIYNGVKIANIGSGYTSKVDPDWLESNFHANYFKELPHVHIKSIATKADLSDAVEVDGKENKTSDPSPCLSMPLTDEPVYCDISVDSGYAFVILNYSTIKSPDPKIYEEFTEEELELLMLGSRKSNDVQLIEVSSTGNIPVPVLKYNNAVGSIMTIKKDGVEYKDSTFTTSSSVVVFDYEIKFTEDEYGSKDEPFTINSATSVSSSKTIFNITGLTENNSYFVVDINKINGVKVYSSTEILEKNGALKEAKITELTVGTDYSVGYLIWKDNAWKNVDSLSAIDASYDGLVMINIKAKSAALGSFTYLVVE